MGLLQTFGQVWRAIKRNNNRGLRQRISARSESVRGDEKIFPFTGQNRRTTIRVDSQRIAKTYAERRKVEDGGVYFE
jgi:hypothetical protein